MGKKPFKQRGNVGQMPRHQPGISVTAPDIIQKARSFPFLECWISDNWQQDDELGLGLVIVVVARQQPDGNICFGMYLIDKLCLGLKSTFVRTNFTRKRYDKEVQEHIFSKLDSVKCAPELAHQMIYQAIDYAAQFEFEPDKDFAQSQYLLAPRGELPESYKITFGRNGKPFFVAGPHDDPEKIMAQLERTAGKGNFDYLAMMPGGF